MPRPTLGLVFFLSACGAPPSPEAAAPRPAVEVPAAERDREPADVAGDGAPGAPSADCTTTLRSASSLAVAPEERELYERALGAEERGASADARKLYYELIKDHPRSKLVPFAYLAFGELFTADARSDPSKWELARASYQEVVKYPPPDNLAYAYATARLGDTQRGRDDTQALATYKKAIDAATQYPELPCSAAVRRDAEARLVEVYAVVGQPDRAWAFLRTITSEARAKELLSDLVAIYQKAGKGADACAAVRAAGPGAGPPERAACP